MESKMNEKFILTLVDKFGSAKIDELELNDGTTQLVLRKWLPAAAVQPRLEGVPAETAAPAQAANDADAGKSVHLSMPASAAGETITSPIVATFYAALSPDSPALVKLGSKVKKGATLFVLEAMKMMNHLEAEFACEILEIHAKSGDFVEYDQVLFTVKKL